MNGAKERDERGSGTVLTLTGVMVLVSLAMVLVLGGGYLIGWRQASSAADLSALSAATAATALVSAPAATAVTAEEKRALCAVAEATAKANRVRLAECAVRGVLPAVVVAVEVDQPVSAPLAGLPKTVPAKAWASSTDMG